MSDVAVVVVIAVALFLVEWLLNRWLNPYLARRRRDRWLREIRSGVPPRKPEPEYHIASDPTGFAVEHRRRATAGTVAVDWRQVVRVVAFKRDLGIVDEIGLAFIRKDGSSVEVDEEMGGWTEFTAALPVHLPGCLPPEEWFSRVAFPAFATNLTEIYSRPLES